MKAIRGSLLRRPEFVDKRSHVLTFAPSQFERRSKPTGGFSKFVKVLQFFGELIRRGAFGIRAKDKRQEALIRREHEWSSFRMEW